MTTKFQYQQQDHEPFGERERPQCPDMHARFDCGVAKRSVSDRLLESMARLLHLRRVLEKRSRGGQKLEPWKESGQNDRWRERGRDASVSLRRPDCRTYHALVYSIFLLFVSGYSTVSIYLNSIPNRTSAPHRICIDLSNYNNASTSRTASESSGFPMYATWNIQLSARRTQNRYYPLFKLEIKLCYRRLTTAFWWITS